MSSFVLAMGNHVATSKGPICESARAKVVGGKNRTDSELERNSEDARNSLLISSGRLQRKGYRGIQIQSYRIRQTPSSDYDPIRLHSFVSLKVSESEYMRIEWYEDGLLLQPVDKQLTLESEKHKKFLTRRELLKMSVGATVGGGGAALGTKVATTAACGAKAAMATGATAAAPRAFACFSRSVRSHPVAGAVVGGVVVGAVVAGGGTYLLDKNSKWKPVREPETALVRIREALIAMEEDEQRNKYDPVHWNCGHFANVIAEVLSD